MSRYTNFVLKKATIIADEVVLQSIRSEPADKGMSVARFVGQLLEREMRRRDDYWDAFERWKKIKPVPFADASKRPTRERIHDRG